MDEQTIILLAVVAAFALFLGLTLGYRMGRQLPPNAPIGD